MDQALAVASKAGTNVVDSTFAISIERYLLDAALDVIESAVNRPDGRTLRSTARQSRIVHSIESAIYDLPGESISVAELTSACQLSERSLENLVREVYGVSPRRLLIVSRLHGSRRELLDAGLFSNTVQAVAERWGFHHGGRFAARYKELFGESPRETLVR